MTHPRQLRAFVFGVPAPFATTALARAAAWRRVVAVGAALGLPRDVQESDITRIGPVSATLPLSTFPRRVYWSKPRRIDAGPLAGSIIVVLDVALPQIAALDGQVLAVPATYNGIAVPGGAGTVTINLSAGVPLTSSHDGVEEELT